MKKFILLLGVGLLAMSFVPATSPNKTNVKRALSAKEIIFLGANFSKLRLIHREGFIDKNGKTKCNALEYKYFDTWNEVFITEERKFNPAELCRVKSYTMSIKRSTELNGMVENEECIIKNELYHVSDKEIQEIVDGYVGKVEEGVGVLVIGESLSKKHGKGKHGVVYFDTVTGEILLFKRYHASPTGVGFDNYWVITIHKCLEDHQSFVKKERKRLKIKY
jgi:hypothetical protein